MFAQAYATITDPISVSYSKVKATTLIKAIDQQTAYQFFFDDELNTIELENINFKKAPMGKLLEELSRSGLKFTRINKNITVAYSKPEPKKKAAPGRLSGKIIDEKGESLPGASVKVIETGLAMQSSVDGTYQFSLAPGTYTLEVSYVSFQTKRIADIVVKDNQLTKLDVVLNVSTSALSEVVIQSSYRKESINGLYAQQKNGASMTNGISAEQIARTPDNNIGAVLKRVSGVNTIDNKYVVVRGMTERYNQAMIDGIIVPSTDMNRRNFSFDVIPAELVSNVVVNKTATPDVSSEFSGGQVTVNTLAIPEQNFISFTLGTGYNSRTTGKDFLVAGGRGKYDYWGFDDGRRKEPVGLKGWVFGDKGDDPRQYVPEAIEQGKQLKAQSFAVAKSTALPNQNYRLSVGRLYNLQQDLKLGFVAGLTYRNTQENNPFETVRNLSGGGNYIDSAELRGTGNAYKFNTTLGGLLNFGLQGEKFKIVSRNLYTRMLNDELYETYNYSEDAGAKQRDLFQDPVFTDILQNKLEGEHTIGKSGLLLNWSTAITNINQDHKDLRNFSYSKVKAPGTYYQSPNVDASNTIPSPYEYDYRLWTDVSEHDYNWMLNLSQPFNFLKDKSLVKVGYTGWYKKRAQSNVLARTYRQAGGTSDFNDFYENIMTPEKMGYGLNQAYYFVDAENGGDQYSGASKYHAVFLMLDQRFFKKLRVVYGVRAENFNLRNSQLAAIRYNETHPNNLKPILNGEKNWSFLPSINATYSLTPQMNVRAAYSTTMVRPDFRETAAFAFPDPLLQGSVSGGNIVSTKIRNYDIRYEWYPTAGEIISVSGFYKEFDRPVELVRQQIAAFYIFKNQKSARNTGFEVEFRKSLNFLADYKWLSNFSLFGNATFMKSEVTGVTTNAAGEEIEYKVKRALYGQAPYIINGGISYYSDFGGFNLVYNRTGYRTNYANADPTTTEFENDRHILDLQLSAKLLKRKAEIRLNISNLLDNESMFYRINRYKQDADKLEVVLSEGSNKYEKGTDFERYRIKYGRTASLTFTYNF
ncbi:TonB-dependent receptor [Mucilaginibacter gynuensis]|uniref:TonB-dependent receptor n=1 Tax=Mucilaginibacter gynuensis TaxID=1302236 RepID=A0ABP8G5L6_9SPHI